MGMAMQMARERMAITARVASAIILCLLLTRVAFSQASGKTVRHHRVAEEQSNPDLAQAEAAIQHKEFGAALSLLKKAVAADGANYEAWFDLGFVNNALGNTDDSIAAYRKSVEAKPDLFESNLNLGLMLAKSGAPDAAQYLRAATRLTPTAHADEGRARAWLSLGQVVAASNPDEAISAFLRAAELSPKDPEPHLAAGPLLEKQNHFADAEQQYKQALALDPSSADALTGLANIYMRGHRYGDAEESLRKLVALRPDDAGAHLQLGRMLAADGQLDAAITELQGALKMAPDNAGVQRDVADVYVLARKYPEAEIQYRTLLASNNKDAELHLALGQTLLKQRKFPQAQQELMAAIQLKPDLGPAYGDLAVAASENKNYALTIKALEVRARLLPEIPVSYFLRATAYDHLRDFKQAAANYHRFLDVANGQYPDQEWQARHRLIAIEPKK
jgi:tetratricopeptide (TPR) repeat protein